MIDLLHGGQIVRRQAGATLAKILRLNVRQKHEARSSDSSKRIRRPSFKSVAVADVAVRFVTQNAEVVRDM